MQLEKRKLKKLKLIPKNCQALSGQSVRISLSVITPNTSTLLLVNAS